MQPTCNAPHSTEDASTTSVVHVRYGSRHPEAHSSLLTVRSPFCCPAVHLSYHTRTSTSTIHPPPPYIVPSPAHSSLRPSSANSRHITFVDSRLYLQTHRLLPLCELGCKEYRDLVASAHVSTRHAAIHKCAAYHHTSCGGSNAHSALSSRIFCSLHLSPRLITSPPLHRHCLIPRTRHRSLYDTHFTPALAAPVSFPL